MQFSLDRKQRRHKRNQCSASYSVGLIFTRSYHSTLLITTPTTTPSLVKTSFNAEAMGSNPVEALKIFFGLKFAELLKVPLRRYFSNSLFLHFLNL